MSVQIFVQGKLLGIEEFLISPADGNSEQVFTGRSHWINLLAEVLPRALLADLNLSKILLGTSGGDQFLVVLPSESRPQVEEFLLAAAKQITELSGNHMSLQWAITENLGDWTDVRKRLNEEMQSKRGAPAGSLGAAYFHEMAPAPLAAGNDYFSVDLGTNLRDAEKAGWSPENPGKVSIGSGKHTWGLGPSAADALSIARHSALTEDGTQPASAAKLAERAAGRQIWGVLRGDVDSFGVRLRRVQTIEEYIQLSVMYKQFFAGELEVLCSMPEFWRKVSILYSGGDDFAIYGSWDALIPFAREVQRLFQRFCEENLKEFPGAEGKTITMALSLAPALDAALESVYEEAGQRLEIAKSSNKDSFYLLGRTIEWKQFGDAADLKETLTRMVSEFGVSPQYLRDLCGIYRETKRTGVTRRQRAAQGERPWRFHRRLNRILGPSRDREFQKVRNSLVTDLVGKGNGTLKLRPSGRVALEWARLSTES